MINRFKEFFRRHPMVRDALLWSIPALVFGAALRCMLLHYSPYAYWGSDSRSFFGFTDGVLTKFYFSINEKRRYLYPLFVFPISLLPGGTLRWLGWIQAALGLATVAPLGYVVRRVFAGWRWLIVPVTLIYAGMPIMIWYEHELIAEPIFFQCVVWALAGWVAWVSQPDRGRACSLWWWFFVPAAILMLTKPAGKFLWPGIVLALILVGAWRILRWKHWAALAGLFLAGLTVGDENQSAWLLYTTAFPLTRLDSPAHAEHKAAIRDFVERKRARFDSYHAEADEVHDFLRSPQDHPERPLWQALGQDDAKRHRLYHDLSIEAIKARPDLFVYIGLTRLAASCNLADFSDKRFRAAYFAERLEEAQANRRNPESMMRIAFGIPRNSPFPPFDEIRARISPHPDSKVAGWLLAYVRWYQDAGELLTRPKGQDSALIDCRPTVLGWWMVIGIFASLIGPYLRPLGAWCIALCGYLFGVYLVGIEDARYFALALPVLLLAVAVVPDWGIRLLRPRAR